MIQISPAAVGVSPGIDYYVNILSPYGPDQEALNLMQINYEEWFLFMDAGNPNTLTITNHPHQGTTYFIDNVQYDFYFDFALPNSSRKYHALLQYADLRPINIIIKIV